MFIFRPKLNKMLNHINLLLPYHIVLVYYRIVLGAGEECSAESGINLHMDYLSYPEK